MLPDKAVQKLGELAQTPFDVVITIGTSMMFPYIHEPVFLAQQHGIPTVEINPCETSVSQVVTHRIPLGAAEAMTQVMAKLA